MEDVADLSDRADPPKGEGLTPEAAADVRTVAKGGAVQIAGQVSQRGLSFIFTAVAGAILGPSGLGVYRVVAQVLAIAGQLGLAGFNYAAMRFIARARAVGESGGVRGALRVGLTGAVIGSLVVFAGIVAGADLLAARFPDVGPSRSQLAWLFRLGAAYVPFFAVLQILRYCTQAYKTMVPSVVAGNIAQPIARFVVGVGLLLAGFGVAGAISSLVASMAAAAILAAVLLRRMLSPDERTAAPRAPVGEMVRFALPQGGASMLGTQTLGLGIIVLGLFAGDAAVGLFAVALALQGPGTVFLGGIVNIWAPVVSDLHDRGEIARLESLYQTINRWVATFSFPVFAALIVTPELFLRLFFPRFVDAAPAVAILALGNLSYTGTGPTGYVISMTGRPQVNLVNSVVGVVLYVGLGVLIVPRYGFVGMAVVDAAVTTLINAVRVIQAKLLVGVQPFGRSFVKPVIATAAAAAVLLGTKIIPGDSRSAGVAGLVVAAIVYAVVLRALGLDDEDRMVLDGIKKRAFRRRVKARQAT